jgi:hypothetical protein
MSGYGVHDQENRLILEKVERGESLSIVCVESEMRQISEGNATRIYGANMHLHFLS